MPDEKKLDPQTLKERLGKHLRTADEFTRFQRYQEAIMEIERALELDPKNNYARSFLERVKLMHKRTQQKESADTESTEMSLEERMALIARHLAAAEEFINQRDLKKALEEVARVYKIDPQNYYAQAYSERIDVLMHQDGKEPPKVLIPVMQPPPADLPPSHAPQPFSPPPGIPSAPGERGSLAMYRELLKDVWLDGKVTEEEARELAVMRETFGITLDEHEHLQHDVKIGAYLEALLIAWRDNTLTDMERKTLQIMREKYGISPEELAIAESRFEELKSFSKSRGSILLVDPDREHLVSMGKMLKQRGFMVLMAQRAEDALQILTGQTPGCIVSEILFPGAQMDGTGFLRRIQEQPGLRRVPFFFMSVIQDRKVLLASYRLGADHVFSKPIDADLFFSVLDGKIRTPGS